MNTTAAARPAASGLSDAAFGDCPGRWPLPAARTPHELWLRAVAAGGQGRYGSALTDLAAVLRHDARGPVASLAHSTRASFLRQLGWHDRARTWDGKAWALAGADEEAGVDALIGLAADALGVGRFAASGRALERARELLTDSAPARLDVRLAWVSGELAMAQGDRLAVAHAERAVELAAAVGSARHAVKSDVILAAAACCAGDMERSRHVADTALAATDRLGLIPLRWALACLLADIGSAAHSAADVLRIRNECAATVRRRGGAYPDR
jgi:hypothetical protein